MRSAASCCHPLQESVVPRAARKGPRDKAPSATVPESVALIKKLRVHLSAAPRPAPHRPAHLPGVGHSRHWGSASVSSDATLRILQNIARYIAGLGIKFLTFAKLTRSESLKVIPEEATWHKKQPHLPGEPFVVLPTIVKHPVRPSGDKEKVANRNATRDRVVL